MTTRQTKWLVCALLGMVVGVARGEFRYDSTCIERLARELEHHGRDLGNEFRDGYRWSPQYASLRADSRDIIARSERMQVLARSGASFDLMRCELEAVSRAFRRINQTIHEADHRGPGNHVHNTQYINVPVRRSQLRQLLECTDKVIGQLNDELGRRYVTRRPGGDWDHRGPGNYGPGNNGSGNNGSGPGGFTFGNPGNAGQTGISIGNGQLTFRFGR